MNRTASILAGACVCGLVVLSTWALRDARRRDLAQQLPVPTSADAPTGAPSVTRLVPPEPPSERSDIADEPSAQETQAGPAEASLPAPASPAEDEEGWRRSFDTASVAEIEAARDALRGEIEAQAGPILDSLHAAGRSEFVGTQLTITGDLLEPSDIVRVYMIPEQGTYRMVLPRGQYPELYALKARELWLQDLAQKRKAQPAHHPGG